MVVLIIPYGVLLFCFSPVQMFWPSFNAALAPADQQYRAIINTVIALTASCVVAFIMVIFFSKESKFDMVSIQNATLAGGVAVGSSSDLVIQPWGALVIGLVAGAVSVVGYERIQPFLSRCIGLDDTCGVNNLHGMPGVIGGIGGALSALTAGETAYGSSIATVFPARATSNATLAALLGLAPGLDRTAEQQAGNQIAALIITLGISIAGGLFTGVIIKMPMCLPGLESEKAGWCDCGKSTHTRYWYEDSYYWKVEEEFVTNNSEKNFEKEKLLANAQKKDSLDAEIKELQEKRNQLNDLESAGAPAAVVEVTDTTDSEQIELTNASKKVDE